MIKSSNSMSNSSVSFASSANTTTATVPLISITTGAVVNNHTQVSVTVNFNILSQMNIWEFLFPSMMIKNLKRKYDLRNGTGGTMGVIFGVVMPVPSSIFNNPQQQQQTMDHHQQSSVPRGIQTG